MISEKNKIGRKKILNIPVFLELSSDQREPSATRV